MNRYKIIIGVFAVLFLSVYIITKIENCHNQPDQLKRFIGTDEVSITSWKDATLLWQIKENLIGFQEATRHTNTARVGNITAFSTSDSASLECASSYTVFGVDVTNGSLAWQFGRNGLGTIIGLSALDDSFVIHQPNRLTRLNLQGDIMWSQEGNKFKGWSYLAGYTPDELILASAGFSNAIVSLPNGEDFHQVTDELILAQNQNVKVTMNSDNSIKVRTKDSNFNIPVSGGRPILTDEYLIIINGVYEDSDIAIYNIDTGEFLWGVNHVQIIEDNVENEAQTIRIFINNAMEIRDLRSGVVLNKINLFVSQYLRQFWNYNQTRLFQANLIPKIGLQKVTKCQIFAKILLFHTL